MKKLRFVTECWAETMLVRTLLIDNGDKVNNPLWNHAAGISDVANIFTKDTEQGYIDVGFVDDDRRNVPHYLSAFEVLDQNNTVAFKKHPHAEVYLIVVSPAIELFLLAELKEIRKQPSYYGLPDDLKLFKRALKSAALERSEDFISLIKDLDEKHAAGIAFIRAKIASLR